MKLELCCPTLFGLEGLVADELRFGAKLEDVRPENGRVFFSGDEHTLAWANLHLRCAERVLICLGRFPATSFEMLFEGTKQITWENWIPADGAFPVKGYSLNSALHSIPDCQKIIKKAVVDHLSQTYGISWFEETGPKFQIQFAISHDVVELYLDSSGAGLHKRGYRANANAAPLRETLAAAIVKIARWRGREPFYDPFCGSGTIAIEAALMAQNRAPGILRGFSAESWPLISADVWKDAREQALQQIRKEQTEPIFAGDTDPECIRLTEENARKAGVNHFIFTKQADAVSQRYETAGTLCTNPPYGERLLDLQAAEALYRSFGRALSNSPTRQYIISSDTSFEQYFGRRADKKRKLYNGMIRCDLYMYFKHSIPHSAKKEK